MHVYKKTLSSCSKRFYSWLLFWNENKLSGFSKVLISLCSPSAPARLLSKCRGVLIWSVQHVMSLCVPAQSWQSLHTLRGPQSKGRTCNSNFWLLWTVVRAGNYVHGCVFMWVSVSGSYYRLSPCYSAQGQGGVHHLILVSTPIRPGRPTSAGLAAQETCL